MWFFLCKNKKVQNMYYYLVENLIKPTYFKNLRIFVILITSLAGIKHICYNIDKIREVYMSKISKNENIDKKISNEFKNVVTSIKNEIKLHKLKQCIK